MLLLQLHIPTYYLVTLCWILSLHFSSFSVFLTASTIVCDLDLLTERVEGRVKRTFFSLSDSAILDLQSGRLYPRDGSVV